MQHLYDMMGKPDDLMALEANLPEWLKNSPLISDESF